MLEALLQYFRTYGMTELHFIIINSKLSHAQALLHELQKRVSFEVFQETDDEEVWSAMEGGKDDMYVYDRCGRLTYYIPFPLSIMSEEQPLVSTAVLATYFRSPCGVTCDTNTSLALDAFIEEIEQSNDNATTTREDYDFTTTTEFIYTHENSSVTEDFKANSSNDIMSVLENAEESGNISSSNQTQNNSFSDIDYDSDNDNIDYQTGNSTNSTHETKYSFLNTLYSLFFSYKDNPDMATNLSALNHLDSASKFIPEPEAETNNGTLEHNETEHNIHVHADKVHNETASKNNTEVKKEKSDRCVEADYLVCKDWSKKRLLHAQKCCSLSYSMSQDPAEQRSCRNFGKRRCKKIKSLLKCCIKTIITEDEEEVPVTSTEITDATEGDVTKKDVTCCKQIENGKLCRISSECHEDEFVVDGPNETM